MPKSLTVLQGPRFWTFCARQWVVAWWDELTSWAFEQRLTWTMFLKMNFSKLGYAMCPPKLCLLWTQASPRWFQGCFTRLLSGGYVGLGWLGRDVPGSYRDPFQNVLIKIWELFIVFTCVRWEIDAALIAQQLHSWFWSGSKTSLFCQDYEGWKCRQCCLCWTNHQWQNLFAKLKGKVL